MEEAEALSTRIGIMVKGGQFKCFGSSQQIRNKFSKYYEIEINLSLPSYQKKEKLKTKFGLRTCFITKDECLKCIAAKKKTNQILRE
jgi:ABC-type multidrug transport system ATPase subunit